MEKKEEGRREGRKVRRGQAGNWKTKRKRKRTFGFPTSTLICFSGCFAFKSAKTFFFSYFPPHLAITSDVRLIFDVVGAAYICLTRLI